MNSCNNLSELSFATTQKTSETKQIIQPDSLLDDLYTNCGIDQLRAMLYSAPQSATLMAWNVTEEDYFANVRAAIELVTND